MMTDEQRKDYQRTKRYIEREQLSPIMNDTKWRKPIDAFGSIPGFRVSWFRVKCIRDNPSRGA